MSYLRIALEIIRALTVAGLLGLAFIGWASSGPEDLL